MVRNFDPDELRRIYRDSDEQDAIYNAAHQPSRAVIAVEIFCYAIAGISALYFALQFMRG